MLKCLILNWLERVLQVSPQETVFPCQGGVSWGAGTGPLQGTGALEVR